MLKLHSTAQFRKDYKKLRKRGYDVVALQNVIGTLLAEQPLEIKYRDHKLSGKYQDCRECHIAPDWLLIYQVSKEDLILLAVRTGSHSDLFDE